MCRGFQQNERDHHHHHHRLLNIKSFYIRLSTTNSISPNPLITNLPHSLTLCYLPRINGSPLEINGSKIPPHSPAFVTLHRLLSPPTAAANNNNHKKGTGGSVYFGSRERVKASQGAIRFEVYLREHKVLKGIFRKNWDDRWKMECSCGLDDDDDGVLQLQEVVKEAEVVCVAAEGHDVAMREKVGMVVKRKTSCFFKGTILEEIPEETECELDDDCCCCCSSDDDEEEEEMGGPSSHFHKEEEEEEEQDTAAMIEMEGVSWAVDVGIWVMCLGVGFLVSSNTFFLRRRKTRRTPFL